MQKVFCSVIDDDQIGYIKGRFIGQNIRLVSDIIENNTYKNGILLFLDFQESLRFSRMGFYVRIVEIVQFWSNVLSMDQDHVYQPRFLFKK